MKKIFNAKFKTMLSASFTLSLLTVSFYGCGQNHPNFSGEWEMNYRKTMGTLSLQENEDKVFKVYMVKGVYSINSLHCTLAGTVKADTLFFTYNSDDGKSNGNGYAVIEKGILKGYIYMYSSYFKTSNYVPMWSGKRIKG